MTICQECQLPIENARSNQKYHGGECSRIAHNKQSLKRANAKSKERSPILNLTCKFCGEVYQTRAARPAATCQDASCKNRRQREISKRIWDAKPIEERRRIIRERNDRRSAENQEKPDKKPKQKVLSKCPGCGATHMHKFEPAWIGVGMPRIKCDRYPACITSDENDPYFAKTIHASWEQENRATI